MLLEAAEGHFCSLEVLDDLADEGLDGNLTVAQSKSALTGNPVSDRAQALWKTLTNWLNLAEQNIVRADRTVFELYVSRPVDGEIVNSFHSARNVKEAQVALNAAKEILWGEKPTFPLKRKLQKTLATYVNPFLEGNEQLVVPYVGVVLPLASALLLRRSGLCLKRSL